MSVYLKIILADQSNNNNNNKYNANISNNCERTECQL